MASGCSAVSPPSRAQRASRQPSATPATMAATRSGSTRPTARESRTNRGSGPVTTTSSTTMATRSMPTVSWRSRAWATSSLVPTPSLAAASPRATPTPRPAPPPPPDDPADAAEHPRPVGRLHRGPHQRHRAVAGIDVDPGLGVGERLWVHRVLARGRQALEQLLALDLGRLHRDRVVPGAAGGAQALGGLLGGGRGR